MQKVITHQSHMRKGLEKDTSGLARTSECTRSREAGKLGRQKEGVVAGDGYVTKELRNRHKHGCKTKLGHKIILQR